MEYSNLYDFISCLEYGTNVHISVVFLDNFGNFKTQLPKCSAIHSKPFCAFMKSTPAGYEKCFKCRNAALKKAINTREPFGGLCFNGVYEYCCPVIENDVVIAVVFIGNILPASPRQLERQPKTLLETFEKNFDESKCKQFSSIVENHIKLLIREYPNHKTAFHPLITNIMNYMEESLYYDTSIRHIAQVFHYNEKYIGKLFKQYTGKTIKEYYNHKKLKRAQTLLRDTSFPVTEISSKTGFNNVTYFNRLFKKHFGISPTAYRQRIKKNNGFQKA